MNITASGPKEIVDLFNNILHEEGVRSDKSKYPIGSLVKVSLDVGKITKELSNGYTGYQARLHARDIAGAVVKVIGVDRLTDDEGNFDTYYSIELDDGRFYVLPENLLSKR